MSGDELCRKTRKLTTYSDASTLPEGTLETVEKEDWYCDLWMAPACVRTRMVSALAL